MNSIGDRIKGYERASNNTLTPRMPVFIRVDGKAFHTFTRGMEKPFAQSLINTMVKAAELTAQEMQGFKLAYVQSDECTFMITDNDTLETTGWFGYEINKLVSITAAMYTAFFNKYWHLDVDEQAFETVFFDARAFNVPIEDAPNVFIWRQRDWERNSIQMLARSHFSQKQLEKKKMADIHEMLHEKGVNWAKLSPQLKNGTFIRRDGGLLYDKLDYEAIQELLKA